MKTNPGFDSTWWFSQACDPAPITNKLPNTGSNAHQPGKDVSLAKAALATINSPPAAAERSRYCGSDSTESTGRAVLRFSKSVRASNAPDMNSHNLVKGR